jgi:hypothetical protein
VSLPSKTLDEIVSRAIGNFRSAFEGYSMSAKKFFGRTSRAVGLSMWELHKAVEDVDKDIVPSPNSSTDALSAWAEELGLPNGGGGYGRLLSTLGSGGQATVTGVKGTVFPNNATATSVDGTVQIRLSGTVTIAGTAPGFGSGTARFVSITPGTAGNLPAGTKCTWDATPSGGDSTFTLSSPITGGNDLESNAAVFARIVQRLQTPPRGGVEQDYREWSAETAGVVAYVYPKRSGSGTVDVVITQVGSGTGRVASSSQKTAVESTIGSARPAGVDKVNVLLPLTAAAGHLVRVRVVPSGSKYVFDWDDTIGYTVDTYTAGTPATLKLNTLAPTSLKSAIDAFIAGTGLAPRLQVLSTGSVVNVAVRAVAYADAGGKTTLTLESLPSTWVAPTAGDTVYAHGPAVDTIAAGVLALCDSLGPSRVSGFGDALTPWNDKLTVSGIIAVAEQAIDTDGTELVQEVPVGSATIDGAAVDVRGADTLGAPELLYLSHVAITQ